MTDKEIEAKLLEVKAANGGGELLVVETEHEGAEVAAFKLPEAKDWAAYIAARADSNPAISTGAAKPLVWTCCVYPDKPVYEQMIAKRPGLVQTYVGELGEFAGANSAKKVRKL
jgi:hypothetical protein